LKFAHDREVFTKTWEEYSSQDGTPDLLATAAALATAHKIEVLLQPASCQTYADLVNLSGKASDVHVLMKQLVIDHNGEYKAGPTKDERRVKQKVENDYKGKGGYQRLVDLQRATGVFKVATDFLECLKACAESKDLTIARVKDRLNTPEDSGYRDVLMNLRHSSGFVVELQLNFEKVALVKSETHRFYELARMIKK